ncbi:MAG: hypothetical protein ABIL50_07980 [candidate division WOR-3 bacterium]
MLWLISDLSFAGYFPGVAKVYNLGGMVYGFDVDSVAVVDTWDGSGSRCYFSTPVNRAVIYSMNYHIPPGDTVIAYFDGTYLVENHGRDMYSLMMNYMGIRGLKFPPTVGDTWMAIDTCSVPLMQWFSYGDFDIDGYYDSIYIYPSTMRTIYINGDTVITYSDSIYRRVKLPKYDTVSIDTTLGDTLILLHREYLMADYVKFVYVAGIGYILYSVDSVGYTTYDYIYHTRTSTVDTLVYPREVMPSIYSRTYAGTGINEQPIKKRVNVEVRGEWVYIENYGKQRLQMFSSSGRKVLEAYIKDKGFVRVPRKGVYFIVLNGKAYKILIR